MDETKEETELKWKCHTTRLFKEILCNPKLGILTQPLQILLSILAEVAKRSSELNDPELNKLMCRLTLYEIADPTLPGHDKELLRKVMKTGLLTDQEGEQK